MFFVFDGSPGLLMWQFSLLEQVKSILLQHLVENLVLKHIILVLLS